PLLRRWRQRSKANDSGPADDLRLALASIVPDKISDALRIEARRARWIGAGSRNFGVAPTRGAVARATECAARPEQTARACTYSIATYSIVTYSIVKQPSFAGPSFGRAWGRPVSFSFPQ